LSVDLQNSDMIVGELAFTEQWCWAVERWHGVGQQASKFVFVFQKVHSGNFTKAKFCKLINS